MTTTISAIIADAAYQNGTDEAAPIELLLRCDDLAAAYRLCIQRSGKSAQEVAHEIDLNYEVLRRVLRKHTEGGDRRYMPNDKLIPFMLACDKLIPFMLACGNSIPLQWLLLQWRALTGVVTLPGGEEVKQVDVLRLQGRLGSIESKLDELIAASRGGEGCSLVASSHWLIDAICDAALEVGR